MTKRKTRTFRTRLKQFRKRQERLSEFLQRPNETAYLAGAMDAWAAIEQQLALVRANSQLEPSAIDAVWFQFETAIDAAMDVDIEREFEPLRRYEPTPLAGATH